MFKAMLVAMSSTQTQVKPVAAVAHLGWRLLALLYDGLIALALLMAFSALVLFMRSGVPVKPGSLMAFAEFLLLWSVIGAYAVLSWRFGGQTVGMRPWRLRVVDSDGGTPGWRALLIRFGIASISLGLALAWCLIDRQRRGLHDLCAGTLMVKLAPKSA
jgi:uncharacterized RDD family membrane protein YckC